MLASSVFFCLSDVLGKWLTAAYPVMQVAWIRSLVGLAALFAGVVALAGIDRLKTRRPAWHGLRALGSVLVVVFVFYGLKNIPLAEFVSLTFSIPLFVALLSPWLLGEKVTRQSWIAVALGFIGVLLVAKPTPQHFHIAHLTSLLLALLIGLLVINARYLSDTENSWSLNFYLSVGGAVLLAAPALGNWISPTPGHWLMLISMGLTQTIALGLYLESMQLARPALIAPLDYVRLIWTIAVGGLIWQEIPDRYTWLGIAFIVAAGVYIVRHGRAGAAEHP